MNHARTSSIYLISSHAFNSTGQLLSGYKGEKTAKEFTCSYVEVICSTDPNTQLLLVFTESGCIDETEGKLLSIDEYSGLGKKTFSVTFVFSIH